MDNDKASRYLALCIAVSKKSKWWKIGQERKKFIRNSHISNYENFDSFHIIILFTHIHLLSVVQYSTPLFSIFLASLRGDYGDGFQNRIVAQ